MRQRSMFRFVVVAAVGVTTLISASNFSLAQTPTTGRVVPASLRIRAFGDAVTAGFGFDASGAAIPIVKAMECRPKWIGDGSATTAGTRCSSNGSNGPGTAADEVSFSADFGLANSASWAAQVASQLNAIDFANYAVAGSSLVSWMNLPHDDKAPAEGAQHDLLERIERDDPDIVLATLGGDLLLQQPASPVRTCATLSDVAAQRMQFADCINAFLDRQMTKQRLMAISFDVLAHTQNAKLLLAHYLPAEPQFSVLLPWQQTVLAESINAQISAAVQGVAESGASWAQRIDVVPVAIQSDGCRPVVIVGPSFLGRTWFTPRKRTCAISGFPRGTSDASFTPISFGTVPGLGILTSISGSATNLIRAHAWA